LSRKNDDAALGRSVRADRGCWFYCMVAAAMREIWEIRAPALLEIVIVVLLSLAVLFLIMAFSI